MCLASISQTQTSRHLECFHYDLISPKTLLFFWITINISWCLHNKAVKINQRYHSCNKTWSFSGFPLTSDINLDWCYPCVKICLETKPYLLCTHRSMGFAHSECVFSVGYDGRRVGIYHGINWWLLRLCPLVRCSSPTNSRHQPRYRCGGHRLYPGCTVGNWKWHHLLQPEHRCTWHYQGTHLLLCFTSQR